MKRQGKTGRSRGVSSLKLAQLRRVNAQITRTLAEVEQLYSFQEKLDIAATQKELVRQLLQRARTTKHARFAALMLVGEPSFEFNLTSVSPRSSGDYVKEEIDRQVEADVFGAVVNQRKAVVVPARSLRAAGLSVRNLIMVPLIARFELLGLILVGVDAPAEELEDYSVRLLSIACKQFALALRNQSLYSNLWSEKSNLQLAHDELAVKVRELETARDQLQLSLREVRLKTAELEHFKAELEHKVEDRTRELVAANAELNRLSSLDGLTRIYNRRYLEEALARENERIQRYGIETTLLVFDIDGLKNINDMRGHLMGDMAIKEAARLLQQAIRRTDVLARFGGDEFVVIAPHTADASGLIHRIHAAVAAWNRKNAKESFELSLSVGWAVANRETDIFTAMQKADEVMYQDKKTHYRERSGRSPGSGLLA